jgi:hypothetical protein
LIQALAVRTSKSMSSTRSLAAGRLAPVAVTAWVVALLGLVGCSASSSGNADTGRGGFSGAGTGGSGINTDCGAMDGANPGTGGSSGAAGSAGLGGASGTGGATGTGCYVTVTAVAPATTVDVEAGKGARMRVEGHAWGTFTPPITWVWTVSVTVGSSMKTVSPTVLDGAGAVVDFSIEDVGRYRVAAVAQTAGRPDCQTPSPLVISTVPAGPMAYDVRVTASGFPVQDMRIALDPSNPQTIAFPMHAGVAANLLPLGLDTGSSLASYIRISDSTSGLSIDADSTHGAVMAPVLGTRAYDVLIVPIDPIDAYAPTYLLNGTPASWPQPLQLDRGTLVNATMRDSKGNAVVGAHLVLRRGSLPSTVGVGDGNGAAVLRARAGTLAAYVEPPMGSGLPSAAVGAGSDPSTDPGIVLDPGVDSLNLAMTWAPVTSAALSIHVLAPGGAAAEAGARVRATSQGAPGQVGTLVASPAGGKAVTLQATGFTDVEVVTNATGTAAFPALPVGAYVVTVTPAPSTGAAGASTPAITSTSLTLGAGGLTRTVTLPMKSALGGTLLPLSDSPGTQITAFDQTLTAPGTVVSAIVATDGTYQLFVDPGRTYELRAQPPAGSLRGRAVLSSSVSAATPPVAAAMLPVAHLVPGTVTTEAGSPVGGALVQAFCPITSPKCLDATFPLAEAITRADGTFQLTLPDPPAN